MKETKGIWKVIGASSLGTLIEWYDFYIFGSLATVLANQFFPKTNPTAALLSTLATFAAGFVVRPFGALVFGRLGDMIGRKYTFLLTLIIMGGSTFAIGLVPGYDTIGFAAPIIVLLLRLLQGLALGGEYGGAATYVAEHAPVHRRGYFTSWIQTTATLGLFVSLGVILITRHALDHNQARSIAKFNDWGWRIPFLLSIFLLAVSVWIRLQMEESPAFKKMKEEGTNSKAPIAEAFGTWRNGKFALIALFGLTAGQAVVWYTGQFYVLFFLQTILRLDMFSANVLIAWSLILGTAGFVIFGTLSDKIGRKKIILAGCFLAIVTYFPVFKGITQLANPALHTAQQTLKVVVITDEKDCTFQFNPVGTAKFTSSCDVTKALLARSSVNYSVQNTPGAVPAKVMVGTTEIVGYEASKLTGDAIKTVPAAFTKSVNDALVAGGYPIAGQAAKGIIKMNGFFDIFNAQTLPLVLLLTYLVVLVTMVYGPIAAALVELFPTRIRYTGMSLPYHIGNGWFGGLLPATSFAMIAQTGDPYYGLWYPIAIAGMTFVIGILFVPENKDKDIFAEDTRR